MGLDIVWQTGANEFVEFEPPLSIRPRGTRTDVIETDRYADFFDVELGIGLQGGLTPEEVATAAERLDDVEWNDAFANAYDGPADSAELRDLRRVFNAYAQCGVGCEARR